MLCQASEMRMGGGQAEKRDGKNKDQGKRRRGQQDEKVGMRNKDVKRSGGMSGGGGCSMGRVTAAFTCTAATTPPFSAAHPPTEASLKVSRL